MARALILIFLLSLGVSAQEPVILEREKTFRQAIIAANQTALHALLAPDFVGIWGDGKQHKMAGSYNLDGKQVDIDQILASEVEVRLYNGDTAIVTGTWQISGGGGEAGRRFTHVWVKMNGEWKLASRHLSTLK